MKAFARRLKALGHTKGSFAESVGISASTIYGWKEPPPWANVLLDAWEENVRLKKNNCAEENKIIEGIKALMKRHGKCPGGNAQGKIEV